MSTSSFQVRSLQTMSRTAHFLRRPAILALAAAGLLFLPASAEAQVPRLGAGWTAGVSDVGDLNADAETARLAPGAGFIVAVHVDRWLGGSGRVGIRGQTSFQQPELEWNADARRISTFAADASVLVRLLTPEGDPPVLPWIAVGAGGIWYEMGRGPEIDYPGADAFHDGEDHLLPVVLGAFGIDIPTGLRWAGNPMGVRLEAADHVTLWSPLRSLTDGERHGAIHQLRFTVGLHSSFSN